MNLWHFIRTNYYMKKKKKLMAKRKKKTRKLLKKVSNVEKKDINKMKSIIRLSNNA